MKKVLWTIDNGIFGADHAVTLVEADAFFGEWVERELVPWRSKMGFLGTPIVVASSREYELHNGAVAMSGESYERRSSQHCGSSDSYPFRLARCARKECRHPSLVDSAWCWKHQPSKKKCSRAGCENDRMDGDDFCVSCIVSRRDSPGATCDNLAAIE